MTGKRARRSFQMYSPFLPVLTAGIFCIGLGRAEAASSGKTLLPLNEYRWGIGLGLGGTGLATTEEVGNESISVKRSEEPAVIALFFERQLNEKMGAGFEHVRGIRLGPVSSGAHFTGGVFRYYPLRPAPFVRDTGEDRVRILFRQFSPFAAGAFGMAIANISREGDPVPDASASGAYFGLRFGADYLLESSSLLRAELSLSTTMGSKSKRPQSMSEFSVRAVWLFPF